jgi:hypothetical protein
MRHLRKQPVEGHPFGGLGHANAQTLRRLDAQTVGLSRSVGEIVARLRAQGEQHEAAFLAKLATGILERIRIDRQGPCAFTSLSRVNVRLANLRALLRRYDAPADPCPDVDEPEIDDSSAEPWASMVAGDARAVG